MGNPLKVIADWLAGAVRDSITAPITELRVELTGLTKAQETLAAKVDAKHADDPVAKECDLSLLDDRICYLIDKARARGYTTAGERRRVGRMHEAYRSRCGNHGEEKEYELYCKLPTEEEWRRMQE